MDRPLTGRSILIVEDQPLIALDVAAAFEDAGAQTTTTRTLEEALRLIESDGLSAAILDHGLADGDSSSLCERLKGRDIPFVIYSGFNKVEGACTEGVLIAKPASAHVLVTTVVSLLQGRTRAEH